MNSADPVQTHVAKTFNHTSPLIACRIDPTGKYVVAAAEDRKFCRWELATGTKVEFSGHDSWARALGFSLDGQTLVTGGYDGRLMWWPVTADAPTPSRTVEAHQGWIRALAVSPDGQLLATCGNDKRVKLWRLADGTLVREFAGHESHVYNVAFHPGGKDLVSGDLKANFIHWEVETAKVVRKLQFAQLHKYDPSFMADIGGPHSMAFSPDGKLLGCGGITNVSNAFAGVGNPAVVLVDWESGKEKTTHLSKGNVQGVLWGLALHPNGYTIGATGGPGGGHLFFWKFDSKDEFHTLNLGAVARDLSLHPDGIQIATAHFDRNLRLSKMAPKA